MSIYEELCQRFLNDLQKGLSFQRKINDEWVEVKIPYEDTLKSYCSLTVVSKVFLWKYKSLPPIENFPPEEKTEWKKYVNEIFPGTTPQFRLNAVKIIYTIGHLTS